MEEFKTTMKKRYRLASFWLRLWAFLIDALLLSALSFLLIRPLLNRLGVDTSTTFLFSSYVILVGIAGLLYFTLMTKKWGQTLGKMVVGIQVIRMDGNRLDWMTVIFREVIGKYISKLLGIYLGYIWAAFHPRRQAWHDLLGDTYVVVEAEITDKLFIEIEGEYVQSNHQ